MRSTRRVRFWFLPAGVGLLAAGVFGTGVFFFASGDTGDPVSAPVARRTPEMPQSGTLRIVFLGDSVARGAGDERGLGIAGSLAEVLEERKVRHEKPVNLAVNGARTVHLKELVARQGPRDILATASVVVISIGGNDLFGEADWRNKGVPNPQAVMTPVLDRIHAVIDSVREVNKGAKIYLIGLYNPFLRAPNGAQLSTAVALWNARLVERFAADSRLVVVQTSDIFVYRDRLSYDRFHPGGEAYRLIARRIADTL